MTKDLPTLKPGSASTEFKGKIAAQSLALALTILNGVLQAMGKEPIILSAEMAASAVVILEALWMIWRQWNKNAEIRAQAQVQVADKHLEGVRIHDRITERTSTSKSK